MDINISIHWPGLTKALDRIFSQLETIMTKLDEFEAKFTALVDQVAKAAAEISAEIAELKKQIEDGAQTTPGIDASLERLTALAQALDDLNPDAPPPV